MLPTLEDPSDSPVQCRFDSCAIGLCKTYLASSPTGTKHKQYNYCQLSGNMLYEITLLYSPSYFCLIPTCSTSITILFLISFSPFPQTNGKKIGIFSFSLFLLHSEVTMFMFLSFRVINLKERSKREKKAENI